MAQAKLRIGLLCPEAALSESDGSFTWTFGDRMAKVSFDRSEGLVCSIRFQVAGAYEPSGFVVPFSEDKTINPGIAGIMVADEVCEFLKSGLSLS